MSWEIWEIKRVYRVRNRKREQVIFWMVVVFMHPCNTTDVLLMAEPAFCKSKSVPLSHSSRDLSCMVTTLLLN